MPMASRVSAISKARGTAILAIVIIAIAAAGSYYALMPKPAPPRPAEEGAPGPGPTIAYALGRGIPEGIAKRLSALDSDGVMDEWERALVDYLARLANMADAARLQDRAIDSILSDGIVSQEEARALAYLSGFPSGANRAFVELGLEGDVIRYLCLMASLGDQSFARYAVENRLCIGDGRLDGLEADFLRDPEGCGGGLFDFYMSEGAKIHPGLFGEMGKLPDLYKISRTRSGSIVAQPRMNVRNIEAIEDVLELAKDARHEKVFEAILNEGIPEKRKYCTPLQALLWILHDKEPDDGQLKRIVSDPIRLTEYAWRYSSESRDYTSERWKGFDEVVDRLNSPKLVSIWTRNNMRYKGEKENEYAPARIIFERLYDDCDGFATIQAYFLKANGYVAWNIGIAINTPIGHNVCGYRDGAQWRVLDVYGREIGPFKSIEELADEIGSSYGIPRGSRIYLIDPFTITSLVSFPNNYQIYRQ